MKKLNDLYSQITPKTSPEELSARIMNTPELKKSPKRKGFRPALALSAAAIAVSSLVVTAGAVNGWDYGAVFESIFGEEKTENIIENIVPEATVLQDTIDNMNFEISAVAADKHSVLAVIDIYSENGYKLIEKVNGNTVINPLLDLFIDINSNTTGAYGTGIHILEESEEKVRLGIRMGTEDMIKDEKVTVNAYLLKDKDENGDFKLNKAYSWSAEFTVDYTAEEIRYEKNIFLSEAEINAVEVSSISACIEGKNLNSFTDNFWKNGEVYAQLDNGEKISITDITGSSYTEGDKTGSTLVITGFAEPINPEDIAALVIGDTIIELK
ncbi:MAG: hypothetical protein J6B08_00215 [Ruminiclostridium sp.]|nr:hypothetical protein [Ruminiclostridium sp.]